MRERISNALKEAQKAKDQLRVSTLRLVTAAIKDREIALRTEDRMLSEEDILQILQKMIRQRRESAQAYAAAARADLEEKELAEIAIIEAFLPAQMSEAEIQAVCAKALADIGACGLKDMGRAMAALKESYPGQMDFKKASSMVKELLK